MLLKVDHVTLYSCDRPVRGVAQSHRLTPSRFDGQMAAHWSVSVSEGTRGGSFRDGAGDWIEGWTVKGPVAGIEVRVAGLVETADLAGVLRGHREQVPPECYLRESPATRMDTALSRLSSAADNAPDGLSAAHALTLAVSNAVTCRPGATHAKTTASVRTTPMCCAPSPARRDCRRVMCRAICSPCRTVFRMRQHMPGPRCSCPALAGSALIRRTGVAPTNAIYGWDRGWMHKRQHRFAARPGRRARKACRFKLQSSPSSNRVTVRFWRVR